jgi:hypothetical protein
LDARERGADALNSDAARNAASPAAPSSSAEAAASGKGLRYARSTDGGRTWSKNATLDPECCECCWNSLLTLPGGVVHVLFRDRDPRDMALVSSADGGKTWSTPTPVGSFGWAFNGCPHVGGALAASDDGKSLNAVVWTAKGGDAVGVFALVGTMSNLGDGKSFALPVQLGGPQSSRPDIARGAGGRVVAVWDAYTEATADQPGGNAAFAAVSTDAGRTWSSPQRLSTAGASATYPRVMPIADGFRVFWTQQEPGKPAALSSRVID